MNQQPMNRMSRAETGQVVGRCNVGVIVRPDYDFPTLVAHEEWMRLALAEAVKARDAGEVPVGAVIVRDGQVLGSGFNQPIASHDPTAHAEVAALRAAAHAVGNYRLPGAALYVTVEPCLMCVGAMVHARIGLLVYGAPEPKSGAIASTIQAHESPGLNHRVEVVAGVLEADCRDLIQRFFRDRRARV